MTHSIGLGFKVFADVLGLVHNAGKEEFMIFSYFKPEESNTQLSYCCPKLIKSAKVLHLLTVKNYIDKSVHHIDLILKPHVKSTEY